MPSSAPPGRSGRASRSTPSSATCMPPPARRPACRRRTACRAPWAPRSSSEPSPSGFDEGEKIGVHLILLDRTHAVRAALVDLVLVVLHDLRGKLAAGDDGDDLIVVAVED